MDSATIRNYINDNATKAAALKDLYNRYKIESVPIQTRTMPDYVDEGTITRLNNDFFSEIIDTKTGYMGAIPIKYSVDDNHENIEKVKSDIKYTLEKCDMADIDAETVKMSAICGTSYRLCYLDEDGEASVMNVDPWEVIAISVSRTGNEIIEALRYFTETRKIDGSDVDLICVEHYTKDEINFLVEDGVGGAFIPDTYIVEMGYVTETTISNFFEDVPLIEFPNNKERLADPFKVLSLIDDYDFTFSDESTELKQWAQAYMVSQGAKFTVEAREEAKKSGCINVPEGCAVTFLKKEVDIDVVKDMREELKSNICRFAGHVDFTDKKLYGQLTQMAIFIRMLSLEAKCIVFERKMVKSLKRQWRLLSRVISKTASDIDYLQMSFTFSRSLPINVSDLAETFKKLRDADYPMEEAMALMPFVKNPKELYEKWLKQQQELFGTEPVEPLPVGE